MNRLSNLVEDCSQACEQTFVVCFREAQRANPLPDHFEVGQLELERSPDELQVLQSARRKLADQQIMRFQAESSDLAHPQRFEPSLPFRRQGRQFGGDDVRVKPCLFANVDFAPKARCNMATVSGRFFG